MQRIIIKEFGPIKDVALDVDKFMVFIGPQASGKSTISKCIFFFKSLWDDLYEFLFSAVQNEDIDLLDDFNRSLKTFEKETKKKFLGYFGPTLHLDQFYLKYIFTDQTNVEITLGKHSDRAYVQPKFNIGFKQGFTELLRTAKEYLEKKSEQKKGPLTSSDLVAMDNERRSFLKKIKLMISQLFDEYNDLIFVPAGRSLLATLSDQIQNIHPHKLDRLTHDFMKWINNYKSSFDKSLDQMLSEKQSLTQDEIDLNAVKTAQNIIKKILKGEYRAHKDGEKIYFDENQFVKISYSSSGQQEAVWILLLIFIFVLENKNTSLVIEEPEAHLYPEAQKEIVDLIALLANAAENQVIITTHSPYILTSLNNLIYARQLGANPETEQKIKNKINPKLWLDHEEIGAYFIENGKLQNIIDPELNLIKTEAIDSASSIINETYDYLFNLDPCD